MGVCYQCGMKFPEEQIGRTEECRSCGRPLHACRNCAFYDTAVSRHCREEAAEPVTDKECANFCEYFRFGNREEKRADATGEARRRFDALFRGESV